jgi:Protein of unknown function (DUF2934)
LSERPESPDAASERRRRRIAERAYGLAAARHFQGGDPVLDWLAAEAEVDAQAVPSTPRERALRWKA